MRKKRRDDLEQAIEYALEHGRFVDWRGSSSFTGSFDEVRDAIRRPRSRRTSGARWSCTSWCLRVACADAPGAGQASSVGTCGLLSWRLAGLQIKLLLCGDANRARVLEAVHAYRPIQVQVRWEPYVPEASVASD